MQFAGRAQPAMLQSIEVAYYDSPTPLQQLASISTPDAQTLLINVYDKSCLDDVERAIMESGLGLTPNNNGEV
jgi:ribosome recycling factor